jgi:hypothetical protein
MFIYKINNNFDSGGLAGGIVEGGACVPTPCFRTSFPSCGLPTLWYQKHLLQKEIIFKKTSNKKDTSHRLRPSDTLVPEKQDLSTRILLNRIV